MKIKIAAKVDKADHEYFEREIEPLLSLPHVEFVGEINETRSPSSCPARTRCCFRSTGRSRSAW